MLGQIIEERYLVEEELGAGAMGHVYRARHIKVRRQVAIKVMHADLARNPTIVERFAREARIAARLHHPNLIGVVDVGMTADKLPLIVLELAPGKSLVEVALDAMPEARVVNIVRQLLLGLEHAHAAGLVHRDLKPDNILVETRADGVEIPRIVDFGIAVCSSGNDEIATRRLTEVNTVIGTPFYMSPEQAMAKPLDHRSDLFSLGVIMYELLAGMLPFPGSGIDVAYANASKDAPPIAERAGIDVDPLLESFVRKLMARRVGERFQSAREAIVVLDLIETDRIAAARVLSGSAPVPAARPIMLPQDSLPANTDGLSTHPTPVAPRLADAPVAAVAPRSNSATMPIVAGERSSRITRVELRAVSRPARRRAMQAFVLAAAALSLVVGWTHIEDEAHVTSPRIELASSSHELDVGVRGSTADVVAKSTTREGPASVDAPVVPSPADRVAVLRAAPVMVVAEPRAARPTSLQAAIASATPAVAVMQETAPVMQDAAPDMTDTAALLAARYVAVGRLLRGGADELWARYRLIRINDALKTEASRREALVVLASIERAIQR